jgi:hypothetical protein
LKKLNFTLSGAALTLAAFAPKSVQHGDERGSLADLDFVFKTTVDVLAEFHPTMHASFYKKGDATDAQSEVVPSEKKSPLIALKMPQIKHIDWDHKQTGCEFIIHRREDLVLAECEVDKFRIFFAEGGVVTVEFRVRARPTDEQAGAIFGLIMNELECSLSESAQAEMEV